MLSVLVLFYCLAYSLSSNTNIQSEITTNTSEVIKIAQTALFNSSSVINQNSAFALKNSSNCHKCQFNKNAYPAIAIEEARIPYRLRNRTKRSATETVYPSAVTENGIPDSAQNKTNVLDKQMEALKELHKVPATRSNLYGYMRNPVVSSMNSLDGVIIKPLLSLGNPNKTDDSTHIIKPNIVLKRPLTASTERTVTSPSSTEGSSVTENGIPDSTQNKTSVLDKQMEALKELHKVPATRSNLYGYMRNPVVSSMNSLDGVIIKPLLSLGNPNKTDDSTHIIKPNIVLKRPLTASTERTVTSPSSTEGSSVTENGIPDSTQNKTSVLDKQMEALKELHKVPATRSNLYGNMQNSVVSSMNSLDGVIIKPLLSLGNSNETDDSTHIIKPNVVLKRSFTASNERTVTSPSSTEGSSVTENGIPDSRQNKTSVLDKQMEALKELHKVPATRSNLYGNMRNSVVSSMNSLDGVIIKPLLSLGNPNEIDNSTHIIKPNIVLKRSFTASNERTVTSPSATEDSNDQSGANTTVISSAVSKNENEISASAAEDSSEQRKINGTLAPSEFSKNENEPSSTLTTSSIKVPDNVSAEMQVEFNGTELLLNVSKIETETSVLETTDVTEQSETVASVQLTSIPQEKNETFTSTSSLTTSSVQVPDEASAEAQEEINGTVPLSNIAKNASETLTSSTVSGKVSNETSPTAEALQNLTSTRLFSETYFYGFCFANRCAFECSAVNQWSYWTPCSGVPGKSFEQRMRVLAFLDRDNTSCFMALEMRKCNMVKSVAECKYSTWNAWSECTGPCNNRTRTRTREVIWPTSLIRHNCNVQALSETRSCPSTCLHEFVEKACDQTANINGVHGINKTRWYYLCGEKPILAQCGKNDGARFLVDVVNIAQTIQFLNGHQFSPVRIFASTIRQTFLCRLPLGSADHSFDVLLSTELQSLAKQFVHTSSESVF
ncbi:hypothetical protein T4C_13476 [Trichinella pseudospiralis]|uniref:Uncharacterized protein n=3 Tax=Trichinella pseudospiralis TaxID=6337 RepID=A0A0V1J4Z8_TRIPS|nr:hypothetical protein T4C_13476 [Trichinella pseudospiralis]